MANTIRQNGKGMRSYTTLSKPNRTGLVCPAKEDRDLSLGFAPAAGRVSLAHHFDIRRRADNGAHLSLRVPLDRWFGRTAVLLAPDENHFGAGFGVLGIEHRERQHLAFVGGVPDPRG